MASGDYVEWTYENISCWDSKIHGNCISYKYSPFDLYPRGPNGDEDNLVVNVYDSEKSSRVELSFIGADGSVIRKQEVQDPKWKGHLLTLPPGPKFVEVTKKVNQKDVNQKDTLRLYRSGNNRRNYGRTTIDVSEECLMVPTLLLKSMELTDSLWISWISVEKSGHLYNLCVNGKLEGSTLDDARISVVLSQDLVMQNFLVHACASLIDCHDVVVKSIADKHVYREDEKTWTFPTEFRLKEVKESELCLTLCVKIIFKDMRNFYSHPYIKRMEPSSIHQNNSSENGYENLDEVVVDSSERSTAIDVPLQELRSLS